MGELVTYPVDGAEGRAYLALPNSGSGPGILLMHAWWGLTEFFTGFADRLAGEGFVVLAPDIYNGRTVDTIEEAEAQVQQLNIREGFQHEQAATSYLLAHPALKHDRIGAIGFSLGGLFAAAMAEHEPHIAAVVLFYGGTEQEEGFEQATQAAFLGHFADTDEYESVELAHHLEQRLRGAGRDVEFYYYSGGAGHWFFENNRPDAYNPDAARLAWERTAAFLHAHLD